MSYNSATHVGNKSTENYPCHLPRGLIRGCWSIGVATERCLVAIGSFGCPGRLKKGVWSWW